MVIRLWIILLILFLFYSACVYIFSRSEKQQEPLNARASHGWKVWQQKNCHTCHQLYGLGGYMGPDLTNMISDPGKGREYMRVFIKYGTVSMPDFHLTDRETDDLLAFLEWVDKSGQSRVEPKAVHWTGTYIF